MAIGTMKCYFYLHFTKIQLYCLIATFLGQHTFNTPPNFEHKAFFSKQWLPAKYTPYKRNGQEKDSLLDRAGTLKRSIRKEISGDSIHFTSSVPYAAIHNEGGIIEMNITRIVTAKMKRFFWAMFFKTGDIMFKYAALKKEGSEIRSKAKIKIPQRQFIGDAPEVRAAIERVFEDNLKVLNQ